MKKKYEVNGMMCAACQALVDNAVRNINGVNSVNVSLLAKNMVVDFDESKVNDDDIISAVDKAGYSACVFVNESIRAIQEKRKKVLRTQLVKLLISIFLLLGLMVFSMGPMIPAIMERIDGLVNTNISLYYFIMILNISMQFVFLIPIVILNWHHYSSGYKSLFSLHPNMDALVALGSTASMVYGLYAFAMIVIGTINHNPDMVMNYSMNIYVESAAMIPVFISLGKYFEAKSTEKTTSSIASLMALTPETALLIKGDEIIEVVTESLNEGDIVLVKEGQSIPTDGYIVDGHSNIDESALTGESIPVFKQIGDKVIGATINVDGSFKYRVSEVGKDSTMGKIVALVEEASSSKAPIARIADKISSVFVPVVIGISILVFILWLILTWNGLAGASHPDINLSLQLAISVLVISCPCALGLATPVAIMVGTGKGAENGILIKNAVSFETLNKTDYVLLDKTGTLTTGKMSVKDYKTYGVSDNELFSVAYSLESLSNHPLSKAIVETSIKMGIQLISPKTFTSIPGKGIIGSDVVIGNKALMDENKIDITNHLEDSDSFGNKGYTSIYVAKQGVLIGIIAVGDTLKENALNFVKTLQKDHKKVGIVTGDNERSTNYIASLLGVDEVYFNVLPNEKENIVEKLIDEGHIVAMIGDGINDAPALSKAHVGISVGAGSDIAIDSSDIVLARSSLGDALNAFKLSRRVVRNIKENLSWAFFYNLILIPLAAGALYMINVTPNWFTGFQPHLVLTPMIASIAMSLSSITVVLNALRLKIMK